MEGLTFDWDEPTGCTSARGWLVLTNHPDLRRWSEINRCVGFYLDYEGDCPGRPVGTNVLACCYIDRLTDAGLTENIRIGYAWFTTTGEAREFIEGNINAYFGLPKQASAA